MNDLWWQHADGSGLSNDLAHGTDGETTAFWRRSKFDIFIKIVAEEIHPHMIN